MLHDGLRCSLPANGRRWMLLIALLLGLSGCAGGPGIRADGSGERVTASDQTDADRRARVRLELASAYFSRGQSETALDEVKQALAANPDLAEAHNLRGLIYASLGETALAEESFRRALQLKPGDGDTMHNYGWFLCQLRRFEPAQVQFAQALAQPQYRNPTRTLLAQGVCHARAGQWQEAERTLMRAYELDPTNPATAVNLSEVLYRRGEYERARFYIGRVNAVREQVSAQTLWLALRIENKSGNRGRVEQLASELRSRFPQAPETLALERGRFDD
ncbi:MAG: type IV pilus biogenesis/stability protein PilW [Pseudomonadota bacterium]